MRFACFATFLVDLATMAEMILLSVQTTRFT